MFTFMIVVNDNGELKSVAEDELRGIYGNESDTLVFQLESVLNSILDDRAATERNETPSEDNESSD